VALAGYAYYSYYPNAYCWLPVIFPATSSNYQDNDWVGLYNSVTYANIVIQEVPNITDSGAAARSELIAEALVHRADAYLQLVNSYAKPYVDATAGSDLGVPLVLKETTTQSLTRASVKAVYDQVVSDLRTAVPSLPAVQQYNFLPTRGSAYAELARCYLYMNRYDSANAYADSALGQNSFLFNLGGITTFSSSTYPLQMNDKEIYLSKSSMYSYTGYTPYVFRLSDTLLHVLDTSDQRYKLFTTSASTISYGSYTDDPNGRFYYRERETYETRNVGPTVPEMMLIKAEYYARSGDAASAMTWVNKLRMTRFTPAAYVALTASSADDALVKVLQEREREFFCRMLRWWDMRRLKADPRFQETVVRNFGGTTYTLAPSGNRYVFQISPYNIKLNPEIQQNP
jgi:tetratricopeptide (TPR) repeat protein